MGYGSFGLSGSKKRKSVLVQYKSKTTRLDLNTDGLLSPRTHWIDELSII